MDSTAQPLLRNTMAAPHKYKLEIKTGRYGGQTLKCFGQACVKFYIKGNKESDKHIIKGSFKAGNTRTVKVSIPATIGDIEKLEAWIERPVNKAEVKWFVEHMKIQETTDQGRVQFFPFHRWVSMRRQTICVNNSLLPQHDENLQRRKETIHLEMNDYYFNEMIADSIPMLTKLKATPEAFSEGYNKKVFLAATINNILKEKLLKLLTSDWRNLRDICNIYGRHVLVRLKVKKTKVVKLYRSILETEDWSALDKEFCAQRLIGVNPMVIQCVRSYARLNETMNLAETEEFKKHMEGMTLQEAIEKEKLFMVDYTTVLHKVHCKNKTIASPIALFFVNTDNDLMPVAIQMFKHKGTPEPDNPVFFPHHDRCTWMLAKMWFNNADASYHQSASHLGFTHLVMETIYLALRQTVSISHPLYQLMAPHFLYLLELNNIAFRSLINEGGWVDTSMSVGVIGMYEIIRRRYQGCARACKDDPDVGSPDVSDDWSLDEAWRLDREGNFENDIKARGVENLPKYHFRDDARAVYTAIKKYVSAVVNANYKSADLLKQDNEIQDWASMLAAKTDDGGCGIQGVPGEGKFTNNDQVIDTITSVIYISSVAHAAVNFLQEEQYGYPLNYPAMLYGEPPRRTSGHDEKDILQCLPTKKTTLGTLSITHLLSQYAVKPLGDFEIKYQYHKIGEDAHEQFKKDLAGITVTAEEEYSILKPQNIPNSISI